MGFSIAAPVGPIGVLCMRRTLAHGRLIGLLSGLGAATADGLYGTVAALGLQAVSSTLVDQSAWLGPLGGLFLCYLGVRTLLSTPAASDEGGAEADAMGPGRAYVSTLALTLTNPMTILAFAGIMAGLGAGPDRSGYDGWAVVSGVVLGSAAWWLTLATVVGAFRRRITRRRMLWVNRVSGLVIAGFGLRQLALAWAAL